MPCKPCREKRVAMYLARGMSQAEAEKRADKIMPLIERTLEKQKSPSKRMLFYKLIRQINWKASIFWSFKHHKLLWIGRGYNPDYTQVCLACTLAGDTSCNATADCGALVICQVHTCIGNCPAPSDPNSSLVSNTCACAKTGCRCTVNVCNTLTPASCSPSPTGSCGYNCNAGYTWNGAACVSAGKPPVYVLKPREGDRRSKIWFSG